MRSVTMNIHDILRIRIVNPSRAVLGVLNSPFAYFETDQTAKEADIEVTIGGFREEIQECTTVDHKYFIKKDYLFYRDTIGRMGWKVELRGLEDYRLRVRVAYATGNHLSLPGLLYPDQVLYNTVLYPLLERCFLKKGYLFLHAGAVATGGAGALFAGRGGACKTTVIMNLAKGGFRSLGDGWSIVKDGRLLPFPTCLPFFEYRRKYLTDEDLTVYHKAKILRFLVKYPSSQAHAREITPLTHCFILCRQERDDIEVIEAYDRDKAAEMLYANNRLEWKANIPYKCDLSRFLDTYEYLYPGNGDFDMETAYRSLLPDALSRVDVYRVHMPKQWRQEDGDAFRRFIGSRR